MNAYAIIILPLNSDVVNLINEIKYNKDQVLLDVESVMSFIFYAFSIYPNFSDALQYSIDSFKEDFLLNRPEITERDVSNTLQLFKQLLLQLYLNLNHYRILVNEQLPYDFGSFLTESEIILKKSPNLVSRI